jgi:hypothetical protein
LLGKIRGIWDRETMNFLHILVCKFCWNNWLYPTKSSLAFPALVLLGKTAETSLPLGGE